MKTHSVFKAIVGGVLVVLAAGSGCKKKEGTAVFPPPLTNQDTCMWNGVQVEKKCCVSGSTVPQGCPGTTPGSTTTDQVRTDMGNLATASGLDTNQATTQLSDAATNSGQSFAKEGVDKHQLVNAPAKDPMANVKMPDVSSQDGGGGSGGGGGSDSGAPSSPLFSADSVRTGALDGSDKNAERKFLLANLNPEGAAYSTGGGAKGSAGGGGSSLGFGSAGGDLSGLAGKSEISLGRNPANAVSPMGSADPQDYFDKYRPGDNIFKIVERRYQQKAENWVLGDSQKALNTVQQRLK